MVAELLSPAKARPGDRVAVLSPSFAAPGVAPAVHEQAMRRLTDLTGLVPVEYPTTRLVGAAPRAGRPTSTRRSPTPTSVPFSPRSAARTRSPSSRTSTRDLVRADPKPFLGYSDNTNIL